ncbi:MAG: FHA domain-containing protein [Acidobacteria bacterium]|nr:FHA domain-containing protein [Acidobacteriota bacterium]
MLAKRTSAALLAALLISGCLGELPRLDRDRRRTLESRPGVVRVSSYATGTFSWSTADIERSAASLRLARPAESLRRPVASGEVETGAGGSSSGFIVHPDGWIVTDARGPRLLSDRVAIESELRRNGARAALERHFEDEALDAALRAGTIGLAVEQLALAGTVDSVRVVDAVELANGAALAYQREAESAELASGSPSIALLRVDRRNLPSLELAAGARPKPGTRLWVVGFPAVATRGDGPLLGWESQDAELDAAFNPGEVVGSPQGSGDLALLETNAAVYEGYSGGPAIDRDHGGVIGVAIRTGGDRKKLVVSADAIVVMLASRGVTSSDRGAFQETYAQALDSAERGDWASAGEKLAAADRLFPSFPDLVRLRGEAAKHERESERVVRIAIPVGIIAALAILAILAYALLRRGSSRKPNVEIPEVRCETEAMPRGRSAETRGPSLGSFVIVSGARKGERIFLSGPLLVIGREARSSDVLFEHPKVSRLHAEIAEDVEGIALVDRGSANGTWVNGRKIDRRILKDGDIIYFGGANAVTVAFEG